MKKILTLLAIGIVGLTSCKKEEMQNVLSLSTYYLEVDTSASNYYSVTVTSSGKWTLTGGESWCIPSIKSGENGDEVTFEISENTSDSRSAEFEFTCNDTKATLSVRQDGVFGVISETDIEVSADGETVVIEMSDEASSYYYDIKYFPADWIEVKNENIDFGGTSGNLVLDIAQNRTFETREVTLTITFRVNEQSTDIHIMQKANTPENLSDKVNVTVKGTLKEILEERDIMNTEFLIITGELNDMDFLTISQLQNLKYLDISDVNLEYLPNNAFAETNIETICLPKTLIQIAIGTFDGANTQYLELGNNLTKIESLPRRLASITIPASVEEITCGFGSSLENIVFEQGSKLTKIEPAQFAYCKIKNISLPNGITAIESWAFGQCKELTEITIPIGVISIGERAFENCESLSHILIPATVATIEQEAFANSGLETVSFEDKSQLKTIEGGYDGYWEFDRNTRYYSYKLSEIRGVFKECHSLRTINIPSNVETIEPTAFYDCPALQTVIFEENTKIVNIQGGYEEKQNDEKNITQSKHIPIFYNTDINLFSIDAINPPIIDGTFSNATATMSILKVPNESIKAYRNSDWASYFSNISGINE